MKGKRDEMTFRQKVEEREEEETYDWFQYLTEEETQILRGRGKHFLFEQICLKDSMEVEKRH